MKRFCLIAAILFLLPTLPARAETVSRIAAVVNDEIITTHQLEREVSENLSAGAQGREIPAAEMESLRRQVLTQLIEKTLIEQRVRELGIKVADEEIEAAIEDVQNQNKLTRQQLIEALRFQGMSFEKYRENLRQQIMRFKLLGREVQAKVEVTNQEIRDYFRQHIDEYREEPYLRLNRISFPFPEKATTVQIEAIREKAQQALARLKQEDFYAVLMSYSADQSAEGGDMGTFVEAELTPAFERAVRDLKEGEISTLVETPTGFHILQVAERSSGKIRQFDAVKEEIQRLLRETKTEERYREWAKDLKKDAYIDIRL